METHQVYSDIRSMIVMLLKILPESDERRLLAQQLAKRYGMVELIGNRVGTYEGGDG